MMAITLKSRAAEKRDGLLSDIETMKQWLEEYWTPAEAFLWLFSPNERFSHRPPAFEIAAGRTEKVIEHLEQIGSGDFT
jgi:hypothetical protein